MNQRLESATSNILVTGSRGFLGSVIVQELRHNHSICSLGTHEDNTIVADLRKTIPIFSQNIDCVVHVAGKAHINPKSPEEAQDFFDVNYQGTKNLLAGLEHTVTRLFIYISTVAVYGLDQGEGISEDTPLNGNSPYASSKIQAESLVSEWCQNHRTNVLILRLPLIIGHNAPGNLGKLTKAIQSRRYVRIGRSSARKSVVLASDVASFIKSQIEAQIPAQGIYNLTDGIHPTLYDLEEAIRVYYGKPSLLSIPESLARLFGVVGDFVSIMPVNTSTIQKMTYSLTFSDHSARMFAQWSPKPAVSLYECQ